MEDPVEDHRQVVNQLVAEGYGTQHEPWSYSLL